MKAEPYRNSGVQGHDPLEAQQTITAITQFVEAQCQRTKAETMGPLSPALMSRKTDMLSSTMASPAHTVVGAPALMMIYNLAALHRELCAARTELAGSQKKLSLFYVQAQQTMTDALRAEAKVGMCNWAEPDL